ncbi:hypothetical protein CALVIDRAFT_535472 [Calocera viscosa TUFC12733]|uniref:Uncharacterized protein n=1 Tax=Calocera viscosa (strain TUFC12733) TaxID=1330018 RepID=A0A167P3L6_CALVF|nr:hypothetical protein CALVIDRAFT_535472 [Calocera viscosa TUFC12733]
MLFSTLSLLLVIASVLARPLMPMPLIGRYNAAIARSALPEGVVLSYVQQERDLDVNTITDSEPTTAQNGVIKPYEGTVEKRLDVNTLTDSEPTTAQNGVIKPYTGTVERRLDVNTITDSEPTTAQNGVIKPYQGTVERV